MIDLSQFVDKKVRVTFRSGEMRDCNIKSHLIRTATYPYIISYVIGDRRNENTYTREGRLDLNTSTSLRDIIKIEEIKPMNKYEELEKKVAEMQKEIYRLKKEEIVHPKIKSVRVTRTIEYHPECYLDYCNECEFVPSQDGFIDYLKEYFYDDFNRVPIFEQTIEEIDE